MILLVLALLHLVGGALVADSLSDFSGTQGYKGWYYKYNNSAVVSEFQTFADSWIGGTNSWQNIDSWCQLIGDHTHTTTGGGLGMCSTPVGFCGPLLIWNNPNPGENVSVHLTASRTGALSPPSYDGVRLSFSINNVLLESAAPSFSLNKTYGPLPLTSLELYFDPQQSCNGDGTAYRLQIFGPDPTPTPSPSSSLSVTPTHTPSPSPTGICNDIRNHLFGNQETVSGDGVVFTVLHGHNVTHLPPFEHCGYFQSCTDLGSLCRCTYTGGTSSGGCPSRRTTSITYSYGTNGISYENQSPSCAYHMSRRFSLPSPSPSVSVTPTFSPTNTHTPSSSATGICNDIKNYVNGRLEQVMDNSTRYNIFHGRYITSPYLPDFDMLIGVYSNCIENGNSCICTYDRGYNVDCENGVARSAIVNYTYGAGFQTSYYNQSSCTFRFNASYIRPSATPTSTVTTTSTSSWTPTTSATSSWTPTTSATSSETVTATRSASQSATPTATHTMTSTESPTQTVTSTATYSPTVTPTGICNDVRNYVFGRQDKPTAEYTILHGDRITHFYYPSHFALIGTNPICTDYGTKCRCVYSNGDAAFCPDKRIGIVEYSYDWVYRTFLINDTDPVCVYRFNTTFKLPYVSPSTTPRPTPLPTQSPFPTRIPPFTRRDVRTLDRPSDFPHIPPNASTSELRNLASGFLGSLTSNNDSSHIETLAALASSLAAVHANLSLTYQGEGFTWVMISATSATPIRAGNLSATLPALAANMVYSFVVRDSNSSFPIFSVDALGTSNEKYTITDLTTPLTFSVAATPPSGMRIECVYWNGTTWDTAGCAYVNGSCACTHFTEFSARFAAVVDTNKAVFGAAGEVYSIAGFKKYAAIYGLCIGLFLGISALFIFLLRLDARGEDNYRLAVEDIEEVTKVLGFEKPIVPQPPIVLPTIRENQPLYVRILTAWVSRLFYHHSYIGVFFRYDPRLPRGFRLLLITTVAFHTLFLTAILYGYTKVAAEMTVSESIILSIITSLLNIPFIRGLIVAMNSVGTKEYISRFPDLAYEYNRRRAFEAALRGISTDELLRVVDRMNGGKSVSRAIQISPLPTGRIGVRGKRGSIETQNTGAVGGDHADTMLILMVDHLIHRCCPRRVQQSGFEEAIEVARTLDPHYETPTCNSLPIKTFRGFLFSCGVFIYIVWIMNYLLLFTASQSTATMNSIASSFGISQATSILITQPLTLLLTLVGTLLLSRLSRHHNVNHIGYFADPAFKKGSSSLSGSWAYWIFLYGGSMGSLGFGKDRRPLGYSSTQVALAMLSGEANIGITPRDAAISTLYVYLRGIQKPLTGRAAARAAAADEMRILLQEAPHTHIASVVQPTDEETGEVSRIVEEIASRSKDGRS